MNTLFVNSKYIKISDPHRLLLNRTDKTILKRSDKYVALSNLIVHGKIQKSHTKIINLKYQSIMRKSLNYLMSQILYQIFKINLNIS